MSLHHQVLPSLSSALPFLQRWFIQRIHPSLPDIQHTFDPLIDHSGNLSLHLTWNTDPPISSSSSSSITTFPLKKRWMFHLSPSSSSAHPSYPQPPLLLSSLWVSVFICLLFPSRLPCSDTILGCMQTFNCFPPRISHSVSVRCFTAWSLCLPLAQEPAKI